MSDENLKTAIKYAVEERDEARRNAAAWERQAEQAENEAEMLRVALREQQKLVEGVYKGLEENIDARHQIREDRDSWRRVAERCELEKQEAERERDAALARERRLREALEQIKDDTPASIAADIARDALADEPEPNGDTAPATRDRLIEQLGDALDRGQSTGTRTKIYREALAAYREWKEDQDGHQG